MRSIFQFVFTVTLFVFSLLTESYAVTPISGAEQRVFHIERSKNKNIVCYDANILATRKLNTEKPVHIYWINQTDHPGEKSDLNYVQNKLAYGYSHSKNSDGSVEISLMAFPDRKLNLSVDNRGVARGKMLISGKPAYLSKIYVQADPSNSLRVLYVDLFGIDVSTGTQVTERIVHKN